MSIQEALETATAKVPGKAAEAELETEHDATVWKVETVTPKNTVFGVYCDAASGKVIDVEEQDEQGAGQHALSLVEQIAGFRFQVADFRLGLLDLETGTWNFETGSPFNSS